MGWVKLDDGYRNHPKIVKAGPAGMSLDVAAMCYCASYLTDGFVPASVATTLYPVRNPQAVVDKLVEVRRWEKDEAHDGYWVHDYLDYNPPAARVLADREKEREKKNKQRRNPDGTFGDVPRGQPTGHGEGLPPPVPSVPSSSSSRPLVVSSVGSSSSTSWAPNDDDEWPVIIAKRRLQRRQADVGPVGNARKWLATTVDDVIDEHVGPASDYLAEHPDATQLAIADHLEPTDFDPYREETTAEQAARILAQRGGAA